MPLTMLLHDTNPLASSFVCDYFFYLTRSLAVGTVHGYKLYSLSSSDHLEPIYDNGDCPGPSSGPCVLHSLLDFRQRGGGPGREAVLLLAGGRRLQGRAPQAAHLPLQEGHRDLQLRLRQQRPLRQDEQSRNFIFKRIFRIFLFESPSFSAWWSAWRSPSTCTTSAT